MTSAAMSVAAGKPNLVRPIIVGGAIAGTLDLIAAFITYGMISPKFIAAGLIEDKPLAAEPLRGRWGFFFTSRSRSRRPPFIASPAESSNF